MTTEDEPFEYKLLESSRDTIRLLRVDTDVDKGPLSCSLLHASMSELWNAPLGQGYRYKAISYEWGSPGSYRKILLDGRQFGVRNNLFQFLYAWRSINIGKPSSLLWIDSISLNQDDKAEKSSQVPRMGEIFRSADEVIAWLGEGSAAVETALYNIGVGLGHTRGSLRGIREDQIWQGLLDAYVVVCGLSYWQRLWIIQELVLAAKATVQYRTTQLDWQAFGGGLSFYCSMEFASEKETDDAVIFALGGSPADWDRKYANERNIEWSMQNEREVFQIYGHWEMRNAGREPRSGRRPPSSGLDDLLLSFEDSKCQYWQDKIYGLLGLVPGGDSFHVSCDEAAAGLKQRALAHFKRPQRNDKGETLSRFNDAASVSSFNRRLDLALDRIIGQGTTPRDHDKGLSSKRLRELEFHNFVNSRKHKRRW